MRKNAVQFATRKKILGRLPNDPDVLGPSRVDVAERWVKKTGPRPVVGEPNAFADEAVRLFAQEKIDRQELMYRLRFGYASKNRDSNDN